MKTLNFNSQEVNLWFTSDLHLTHAKIIEYCSRPFENVQQMNEEICKRWNETVSPDDIVFVLGDFCFAGSQLWKSYIYRLNGFIWLIKGNHDRDKNIPQPIENKFNWTDGFLNITIQDKEFKHNEQRVTLCHYPMLSWYQSHRGAWQLFGHIHSGANSTSVEYHQLRNVFTANQMDVGVDAHNFYPIHWETVKTIITKQNLK